MPKGSDLVFELHYTTMGQPTEDASKIGLVLAKNPPQSRYFFNAGPTASNLAIPPGDENAEVVSEVTLNQPAKLVYAQPHMHLRGKDFELRLVYPTGETETVLKIKWDFNWQIGYELAKPIDMPKGTRMVGISHFDNSANNRFNPDPTKRDRVGPAELGRDEQLLHRRDYRRRRPGRRPCSMRSGPSLLPRGLSGPTLAALEAAKRGE